MFEGKKKGKNDRNTLYVYTRNEHYINANKLVLINFRKRNTSGGCFEIIASSYVIK